MEKKFLNIDELSQYLGIKKSNLYSRVERKEIPFYRWGRMGGERRGMFSYP